GEGRICRRGEQIGKAEVPVSRGVVDAIFDACRFRLIPRLNEPPVKRLQRIRVYVKRVASAGIEVLRESGQSDRQIVGWVEQERSAAAVAFLVVDVVLDERTPEFLTRQKVENGIIPDRIDVAVILAVEAVDANRGLG